MQTSLWRHRSLKPDDWLMEVLARGDWKQADLAIREDPLIALNSCKVDTFLGSRKPCKITAMHQACAHKAPLELIELLQEMHPSSLQTRDSIYKRLPLHVALMTHESTTVVSRLLDLDPASAQGKDILDRHPLHYACHHNAQAEFVGKLVAAYPLACCKTDANGWLPVHVACRFDMPVSVIQLLLDKYPSSIHKQTDKGSTPVHCAKKNNNQELVKLLRETAKNVPEDLDETADLDALQKGSQNIDFVDLSASAGAGLDAQESSSSSVNDESTATQSTTPSSTMPLTPIAQQKNRLDKHELARLAFSPLSPYANTKQAKIPFLGQCL